MTLFCVERPCFEGLTFKIDRGYWVYFWMIWGYRKPRYFFFFFL